MFWGDRTEYHVIMTSNVFYFGSDFGSQMHFLRKCLMLHIPWMFDDHKKYLKIQMSEVQGNPLNGDFSRAQCFICFRF